MVVCENLTKTFSRTSQKCVLFLHSAEGRRTEQKNDGGLELQGTGQLVRTVQQEIEAVRP